MKIRPPGVYLFHDLLAPCLLILFVLFFNTLILNLGLGIGALLVFVGISTFAKIRSRKKQAPGLLQTFLDYATNPAIKQWAIMLTFLVMALNNTNIPDTYRKPILIFVAALAGLYFRFGERKSSQNLLARVVLVLFDFMVMLFAIVLITWRPGWAALFWSILLCLWILIAKGPKKKWFFAPLIIAMGIVGIASFVIGNVLSYSNATPVLGELIHPGATYDVSVNDAGEILAVKRKPGAMLYANGKWQSIANTKNPQRVAVDPKTGGFYISNYGAEKVNVYTEVKDGKTRQYGIEKCDRTIDIDVDPTMRKLLVLCEGSNRLVIRELDEKSEGKIVSMQWCPYALAVNKLISRVYVSTLLSGVTHYYDLKTKERAVKYTGQGTGVEVDEKTGDVYLARYATGDILVMDQNMKVKTRIQAGLMPRDIAIDKKNRVLIAGNYLSGTIQVIDLDQKKVSKVFRIDQSKGHRRILRGVEIAPDGFWYLSDWNGIWKVAPVLPDESQGE